MREVKWRSPAFQRAQEISSSTIVALSSSNVKNTYLVSPVTCTIRCISYQARFLASRSKSVDFECSLTPDLLPPWAALKELLIVNRLYSTLLSSTDRMSTSGGPLSEKRKEREKREGRLLGSAAGRLGLRSTKREEVTRVISRVERSRESN